MNRRISIIVACSLVLSICASYLVYRAVNARASTQRRPQTTPVVVAARDIDAGSLIRDIDLRTAAWSGAPPKGAVAKPESILNRGVATPIFEGEPVTETRLAHQGSGGGLAGTIPTGMRACAVRVNEVVGVAGFVVPGMRVDVLIIGTLPGGDPNEGPRVRTLLQNIQVLSAGTNYQPDQESKPEQAQVVNLLVTPAQAELLSLASNETRIQLVLRNPMDTQIQKPPGSMVADLFGLNHAAESVPARPGRGSVPPIAPHNAKPTPVPPAASVREIQTPASAPYVVEMLNGSARTRTTFSSAEAGQ
jgi:pilus assembly protein CpaB